MKEERLNKIADNFLGNRMSIPTLRRVIGNSNGEGISKAKILKESMKQNWNFLRGGGFKPKNPLWERYGSFLEQHYNYLQSMYFRKGEICNEILGLYMFL